MKGSQEKKIPSVQLYFMARFTLVKLSSVALDGADS